MENALFGTETEYAAAGNMSPTEVAYRIKDGIFGSRKYGLIEPAPREWGESPGNGGFLFNGGRMYLDSGHLEYATPECRTLDDLIAAEHAGDRILLSMIDELQLKGEAFFIKNNTDHFGNTYGYHENYCIRSSPRTRDFVEGILPFLVTRQIFAGAGMYKPASTRPRASRLPALPGTVDGSPPPPFQISQRAPFTSVDVSHRVRFGGRPILNLRDESHAGRRYSRLHNIIGDANRSEFATKLKIGTMALVAQLLDEGWTSEVEIELEDPVASLKKISGEPTGTWMVKLANGSEMSAIDIQRVYLHEATRRYLGRDEDTIWVLRQWASVLNTLETDRFRLDGYLDWVTKFLQLKSFAAKAPRGWEEPALIKLDLAYHHIDPSVSLFNLLQRQGKLQPIIAPERAEAMMINPPTGSRANARGRIVQAMSTARADSDINWALISRRLGERASYGDERTMVYEYVDDWVDVQRADAWYLIPYIIDWGAIAYKNHILELGDPFSEYVAEASGYSATVPDWVGA